MLGKGVTMRGNQETKPTAVVHVPYSYNANPKTVELVCESVCAILSETMEPENGRTQDVIDLFRSYIALPESRNISLEDFSHALEDDGRFILAGKNVSLSPVFLEKRKALKSTSQLQSKSIEGMDDESSHDKDLTVLPESGTDIERLSNVIGARIANNWLLFKKGKYCSCKPKFIIISGKAGTGKTTTLTRLIVELARKYGDQMLVMAPTGRAADVVKTKLWKEKEFSVNPKTIHRTIYDSHLTIGVDKNGYYMERGYSLKKVIDNQGKYKVMIIDESSMIKSSPDRERASNSRIILDDLIDFATLMWIPTIIFAGDEAQLPPVGEEFSAALSRKHLRDRLARSVHEYRLSHVYRQSGAILDYANAFRDRLKAEQDCDLPKAPTDGLSIVESSEDEAYKSFVQGVDADESKAVANSQILKDRIMIAATNTSVFGMNHRIRSMLNYDPDKPVMGDIILICKNSYYENLVLPGSAAEFFPEEYSSLTEKHAPAFDSSYEQAAESIASYESKPVEDKAVDVFNGNRAMVTCCIEFSDDSLSEEVLSFRKEFGLKFFNVEFRLLDSDELVTSRLVLFKEYLNQKALKLKHWDAEDLVLNDLARRYGKDQAPTQKLIQELHDVMKDDIYMSSVEVMYGYAVTGHKAQGGEWNEVYIDYTPMYGMSRNTYLRWSYTSTARARERLVVIKHTDDVEKALALVTSTMRNAGNLDQLSIKNGNQEDASSEIGPRGILKALEVYADRSLTVPLAHSIQGHIARGASIDKDVFFSLLCRSLTRYRLVLLSSGADLETVLDCASTLVGTTKTGRRKLSMVIQLACRGFQGLSRKGVECSIFKTVFRYIDDMELDEIPPEISMTGLVDLKESVIFILLLKILSNRFEIEKTSVDRSPTSRAKYLKTETNIDAVEADFKASTAGFKMRAFLERLSTACFDKYSYSTDVLDCSTSNLESKLFSVAECYAFIQYYEWSKNGLNDAPKLIDSLLCRSLSLLESCPATFALDMMRHVKFYFSRAIVGIKTKPELDAVIGALEKCKGGYFEQWRNNGYSFDLNPLFQPVPERIISMIRPEAKSDERPVSDDATRTSAPE